MANQRRQRIDWARVERDHATGKFTDQELADRHGTAREVISRRRRADRLCSPSAWPIDRTQEVRRATAALLMQRQVTATVTAGTDAQAVMAAAQATKDVILGHRAAVRTALALADRLMAELADVSVHRQQLSVLIERAAATLNEADAAALTAQARELVKLHSRVGSLQKLADSLAKLHPLERRAMGIADDEGGGNPLDAMSMRELEAEVARLGVLIQAGAAPG